MKATERPRAFVVGTGFGCRVHVPALRNAGFDVVALVGTDPDRTKRRAERAGVPNAFTSLDDAVALGDVHACTIATPPHTHAPLAIAACNAGLDIICEKPFALCATEAQTMLAAAERAGVMHLVGHEFRWAPDRALTARVLRDGLIGQPRMFTLTQYVPLVADPAARVPHWWFDAANGGGWLGASGSHVIDQILTSLGPIASVSATLPSVRAHRAGAEDSFAVHVVMQSGATGVLQQTAASWTTNVVGVTVIAGTEGTLEMTNEGVVVSDRNGRGVLAMPDDLVLPAHAPTDDPRERFTHLELGPYTRLCESLRGTSSAVPLPTFADGVAVMHVLDAIRQSAAAGGARVDVSG